jgi:hypothetical protein
MRRATVEAMTRALGVLLAVTLVAVLTVSASAAGTTATLVRGVVLRSPITPVCVDGRPCSAPVAGATLVFTRSTGTSASATTNRLGRFSIRLAPGAYGVRLRRATPLATLYPRAVRVPMTGPLWLRLHVDTGIRLPGPGVVDR